MGSLLQFGPNIQVLATIVGLHLVRYQREVDKGKLTAVYVASFEKLTFRV